MTKKLFAITAIILCLWVINANSKPTVLDSQQIKYLLMARSAGGAIGWPETMETIIWQESSIGKFKIGDDGKSLGIAHVQIDTAIAVMKKYQWVPQMPSKTHHNRYKIAERLIHDDNFNLLIASLYFNDCYQQFQNWRRALICYNGGPKVAYEYKTESQVNNFPYVLAIQHRLRQLREDESKYYVLNSNIDPSLQSEEIAQVKATNYFGNLPINPSGPDILYAHNTSTCVSYIKNISSTSKEENLPSSLNKKTNTINVMLDNQHRNSCYDKANFLQSSG